MSEELYCSKCGNAVEETLVLSCQHNLCIHCAAENISRQESSGINQIHIVTCDLCKSQTEIDNITSKNILSIAMGNTNNQINSKDYQQFNNTNTNTNDFNNSNTNLNQINTSSNYNTSMYPNPTSSNNFNVIQMDTCSEHGELLNYICFDCLNKWICSECVVHGIHKNHEVINIKKAYPIIYEKTEELNNQVDLKVKELIAVNRTLEAKKGEIVNNSDKCKREIKMFFDDIRQILNKKEKEFLDKTDGLFQENIQEINTYSRILQSKIINLNKLQDSVQAHLMRKDELTLINYYNENKNKILSSIETPEIENIRNGKMFANGNIEIDKSPFNEMTKAINDFHFNASKQKMNLNKISTSKYIAQRNLYGINSMNRSNMIYSPKSGY